VAASPAVRPGTRTVHINWTWGRPRYLIKFNELTTRVMGASWTDQTEGWRFQFEWPPDSTIKIRVDPPYQGMIVRDDRVVARIVPVWQDVTSFSYRRTPAVQLAEIHTDTMSLKFVCDVICNYCPTKFRILSEDGLRFCVWQRTGGWGEGGARVLISKRVDSELLPILVAVVIVMMQNSGGD
jgi:hypothetical protein